MEPLIGKKRSMASLAIKIGFMDQAQSVCWVSERGGNLWNPLEPFLQVCIQKCNTHFQF